MLWRVRTTMPDRPGSLARLAEQCGRADVNILGLQIFPGVEAVTDELVLRTPSDWREEEIERLVQRAGGGRVAATVCSEAALVDQPTRYVQAARSILAQPASFPEIVATLFDAEPDPGPGAAGPTQDVMEMSVGDVQVQVRRHAPFTPTEHARGAAMADLVTDVLARSRLEQPMPSAARRVGSAATPTYVVGDGVVSAAVDGTTVGIAQIRPEAGEEGVRELVLRGRPRLAAARHRHPPAGGGVPAGGAGRRLGGRDEHPRRQPGRPAAGAGRRAAGPDPDVCRAAHGARPGARLRRRPLRLGPGPRR